MNTYQVGHIIHKMEKYSKVGNSPIFKFAQISYPTRLEAMALDPSLVEINAENDYRAGQMILKVAIFRNCTVKVVEGSEIVISKNSSKSVLCLHAALLMKYLLNFHCGLEIEYTEELDRRHSGLGSSSGCIAAVSVAINELFGNPIEKRDLVNFIVKNHGEEMDSMPDQIVPVQCLGGSAISGHYDGGLLISSGDRFVIGSGSVDTNLDVIIMIPNKYNFPDSKKLMDDEEINMGGFLRAGKLYASNVAYRLIHEVLPDLQLDSIQEAGKLAWDYRYHMGSIHNCSFTHPEVNEISNKLNQLYEENEIKFLSMSSVGPGFFAVLDPKHTQKYKDKFEKIGLECIITKPYNGKYKIINLK